MTSWAHSTPYGAAMALGPVQRDVLTLVLAMTEGGRRPELTLRAMAARTGRPVSSVHDALGRLRALGLIGLRASIGRHGGHRLWRVAGRAARVLDPARHRRAIARLVARFSRDQVEPPPPDRSDPSGVPPAPDGPDHPYPTRHDPPPPTIWAREPFRDLMRRHGIGAWIDERRRE